MGTTIYTGQGITKDCVVGDRLMNRYALFNGLERPRRIDSNLNVTVLGTPVAPQPNASVSATAGNLETDKWYAYRVVYASSKYPRPVAVSDGSGAYTRGNPSPIRPIYVAGANKAVDVSVSCSSVAYSQDFGVTHVLLYRSVAASTQGGAEAGPFYYVGQAAESGASVTITDGLHDDSVGESVETDNFVPNAYRYAIDASGYIFAGGNLPLGNGYTCTVTAGSSTVTASDNIFYDGVVGWTFKCLSDSSGGVDGAGAFYANYVSANTLMLVDANGDEMNYDGALSGAGQTFLVYLPGFVLRWSKYGEPEAWPSTNIINFEGDITGIGLVPNMPLLLVSTDEPSIYVLDLTQIGTYSFKVNRRLVSTTYMVTSHYSLVSVEGRLRGIDARNGCIIETDGVSVRDISSGFVPKVWDYLDQDENSIKNWHCAYDRRRHLFGAFVAFRNSHRMIDFCIGQHTLSGGWFFNLEKDLLSTGHYVSPDTGEPMVLGGTQGLPSGGGAVWGRIWAPGVYDEWIPDDTLRSGTLLSATSTTLTVDNSSDDLYTANGGLAGRWVLTCDANGEYAQMGYIESNTANTITITSVLNSPDVGQFNPVPSVGWLFYLGLIEVRWGPKRFDMGAPHSGKAVMELRLVMEEYDDTKLPFLRLFRGHNSGYTRQVSLVEDAYLDGSVNEGLRASVGQGLLGGTPRWGVALLDRSYNRSSLKSFSIGFLRAGGQRERK